MRVVDFPLFALAFLVDSIICPFKLPEEPNRRPPIPLPRPPYEVFKMAANMFPQGVLVFYRCQRRGEDGVIIQSNGEKSYQVQHGLYVVISKHRIIGYVKPNKMFYPLNHRKVGERLKIIAITPDGHLVEMEPPECNNLGLFREVPENTIFRSGPVPNEPDITLIEDATGHVHEIIIDGHTKHV